MKKERSTAFNPRQYMLSRDFEIYYYSDLHFQSVGRHSHDYHEFYFFVEGAVSMELGDRFAKGEIDKVELIYHHFKSAGSQILTHKTFLPIDLESELNADHERDLTSNVVTKQAQDYLKKKGRKKQVKENEVAPLNDNFIVEPDMHTVLSQLIPKMGHLMLYTALLDNVASEHAARMVAMQTATDNADELLRQLNLQYNKSRQQAITSELLDIVGGSVNN